MPKLKIIKAHGNYNDFIILLKQNIPNNILLNRDLIQKICKQENSVDGFVLLDCENFLVDYYNNDGSWETLCVNSLRCVGLVLERRFKKSIFKVKCGDGNHTIKIESSNNIIVSMPTPIYETDTIMLEGIAGYYINSGAKHFVIHYDEDWEDKSKLEILSRKIRYNKKFFPEGVNVNFFKIINKQSIYVKTYEKGIESMMPSCASGSFACAYHYALENKIKNIDIKNDIGHLMAAFNFKTNSHNISGDAIIEYMKEINI